MVASKEILCLEYVNITSFYELSCNFFLNLSTTIQNKMKHKISKATTMKKQNKKTCHIQLAPIYFLIRSSGSNKG